MFQLSRLEDDNVKILPENLGKPTLEAIVEVIERLYVDKVIRDLGLVITLYDVVSVEGGTVYPGEGSAHFKVVFRVVVFRPFVGEVLEATLKRSDEEGLRVSLGFFDDVFVPAHLLQDPSNFDDKEKLWVWEYQGDAKQKMHFDLEEKIRVRVQSVRFPDHPTRDARRGGEDVVMATRSALEGGAGEPHRFAPMVVVADVNADGLGLVSWWADDDDTLAEGIEGEGGGGEGSRESAGRQGGQEVAASGRRAQRE